MRENPLLFNVHAGWTSQETLIGVLGVKAALPGAAQKVTETARDDLGIDPAARARLAGASGERFVSVFQYASSWLDNGFSLGADCPLRSGLHHPLPGKTLFAFLSERALSPQAFLLYEKWADLKKPHNRPATLNAPLAATLLAAHPDLAAGGLKITPQKKLAVLPRAGQVPHHQLDDLVYSFHAYERALIKDTDLPVLVDGLGVPGRLLKFYVRFNDKPCVLTLKSIHDPINTPFWRYFALKSAQKCRIPVCNAHLENVMGEMVLIRERLDRQGETALPVFSAAALAQPRRHPGGRPMPISYLAIADIINREGADPRHDLPALFRRIAYVLLTGKQGDRPDRWLFVREPLGWRLLPAHSLAWTGPALGAPVTGGMSVDGRHVANAPEDLIAWAPYFALSVKEAKTIVLDIRRQLASWENDALALGADPADLGLIADVFSDGW